MNFLLILFLLSPFILGGLLFAFCLLQQRTLKKLLKENATLEERLLLQQSLIDCLQEAEK